uniref:Helix-turn-helix domain-containing protein n=1 Tax=Streptomyces sp. NBC_00003 TaxID=2903608 RepID=A0AAU2V7Y5_9ACTN
MAFQHPSAPPCVASPVTGHAARSGVIHDNTRHATRYTVIGNHLAQHTELSLLAIGLGVHIQSLPAGARIGIKCLAARFPESEHRIAGALRELERHGYLTRTRERLPSGRVVTRTVSHNQPGATPALPAQPASVSRPAPEPVSIPECPAPPRDVTPPEPDSPAPEGHPAPEAHPAAVAVLAGLRRTDPRLTLSERDVHRLAPAAMAWLERGVSADAVRRTLTADLPDDVRHPAGLLAHRLNALLPPPLPAAPARPDPMQACEECGLGFRAPGPGYCVGCRPDLKEAA